MTMLNICLGLHDSFCILSGNLMEFYIEGALAGALRPGQQ